MVIPKDPEEDMSAVKMLAEDYKEDLAALRNLTPVIVTDVDIDMLKILASKYGLDSKEISRQTFIENLGKVGDVIRTKLEVLAIEHVLASEAEVSISKKPKAKSSRKDTVPDILKD